MKTASSVIEVTGLRVEREDVILESIDWREVYGQAVEGQRRAGSQGLSDGNPERQLSDHLRTGFIAPSRHIAGDGRASHARIGRTASAGFSQRRGDL
jgi:hypothetical protein